MRPRTAVIPVAGLGTRMLPATKAIPKELVAVAGKPAIQWVVEDAVASGIERVVLVTSAGKSAIEDHFDAAPLLERTLADKGRHDLVEILVSLRELVHVTSVRQPEPLGLGHAVLMAREVVGDETFAVILPDELLHSRRPAMAQCVDAMSGANGEDAMSGASAEDAMSGVDGEDAGSGADCVIGLARVPRSQAPRYGMVECEEVDERTVVIGGMVEKPSAEESPSDLAIVGPYVLTPDVFDDLAAIGAGSGGEIQLTDALRSLVSRRRTLGRIVEGERLDVGQLLGFVQANVVKGLADPGVGEALRAWLAERLE